MKNSKGFTMVELLGAIVILGILMLVAIPSVKNFINKGKDSYYQTQKKNLEGAAKTYFRNKHMLLRDVGDSAIITMDELVSNRYISVVRDAEKMDCVGTAATDLEKKQQQYTFVYVKKEKNKITYKAHLYCPAKTDDPKIRMAEDSANISAVNISITKGSNLRSIVIKMDSSTVKINKYSFSIFVGGNINETSADNMIANKSEIIDKNEQTVVYDVSRLLAKQENIITCYVVTMDENGDTAIKWATFDFEDNATPECTDKNVVVTDMYDKFKIDFDFVCKSTHGCDNDHPSGTIYETAQKSDTISVDMTDRVTGLSSTCVLNYTTHRDPPEPTHTPVETCPAAFSTKGCPKASISSSSWTNKTINVCYRFSNKTTGYAISRTAVSSGGWAKTANDNHNKTIRRKAINYSTIKWGSASSAYQKKSTFSSTGNYYVIIKVRQDKGANGTGRSNNICGTTYAYGPYRVDKTKPTVSSKKVTAESGYYLRVKFTTTDKHSKLYYLYVNETPTATAAQIKKNGQRFNPTKTSYSYNKKKSCKKNTTHKYYAHVLDTAGNITNTVIGEAKANKK